VPESSWIVKDFVSHVGSLDPELARTFEAAAAGRPEEAGLTTDGRPYDLDALNESLVTERRSWPLERILAEGARDRSALPRGPLTYHRASALEYWKWPV